MFSWTFRCFFDQSTIFKNVRRTCHDNWNSISLSRYKVGIHTEHRFDFQIGLLISRLHSSGYHVMCFTRAKIEFVLVFCYTFQNINKNRLLNFSKLNFGEIFNSGFFMRRNRHLKVKLRCHVSFKSRESLQQVYINALISRKIQNLAFSKIKKIH